MFEQHECQHHHSKTKKHSKKSKKHHRKRSRSRSVSRSSSAALRQWPRRKLLTQRATPSVTTHWSLNYLPSLLRQGSESEDEEYHKKKKRSQSKSPSEHSSSGESGEWVSQSTDSVHHVDILLTPLLVSTVTLERSYKKSKKHKKKAKKRRHKSVSDYDHL